MALPHTVRYSTLSRLIFPSLLMFVFVIAFTLLLTMEFVTMYQEMKSSSNKIDTHLVDETTKRLMVLEKKILFKTRLYGCGAYTKTRFETTKYLRKENAKLIERVNNEMDPDKCQRLANNNQSTVVDHYNKLIIQSNMTNNVSVVVMSRDFFNYLADHLRNSSYPGVEHYTRYVVARLGLSPLVNVVPLIGEFGLVINDVLSFKYPISIQPCVIEDSSGSDSSSRNVFIAVNSAPGNFDRRQLIRQTWRKHLKDAHRERLLTTAGFTFTLGLTDDHAETQQKIEQEAKTYAQWRFSTEKKILVCAFLLNYQIWY